MPKLSPRDIRRKIQGIRNTRRITNAMKVVSAAKLRRAQELIYASRPYSERLYEVLKSLSLCGLLLVAWSIPPLSNLGLSL